MKAKVIVIQNPDSPLMKESWWTRPSPSELAPVAVVVVAVAGTAVEPAAAEVHSIAVDAAAAVAVVELAERAPVGLRTVAAGQPEWNGSVAAVVAIATADSAVAAVRYYFYYYY